VFQLRWDQEGLHSNHKEEQRSKEGKTPGQMKMQLRRAGQLPVQLWIKYKTQHP
jgi:hypothetical protein